MILDCFLDKERSSEFSKVSNDEVLASSFIRVTLIILFNVSESRFEGILIDLSLTLLATDLSFDFSCNLFNVIRSEVASILGINSTPAFFKSCLNLSLELLGADFFDFRENELCIFTWILVQDGRAQWEWSQLVREFSTITDVDCRLLAVLIESEGAWPDKRAYDNNAMTDNFTSFSQVLSFITD